MIPPYVWSSFHAAIPGATRRHLFTCEEHGFGVLVSTQRKMLVVAMVGEASENGLLLWYGTNKSEKDCFEAGQVGGPLP